MVPIARMFAASSFLGSHVHRAGIDVSGQEARRRRVGLRSLCPLALVAMWVTACHSPAPPPEQVDGAAPASVEDGELDEGAQDPVQWPTYLPDGQPNIQGLWHYVGGSLGLNIEALPNMLDTGRTSPTIVVDPSDGILPYHPWARARRDEVLDNYNHPNHAQVDPQNRGWPDGVPRLNYYSHFIQILQPPGSVVMLYEVQHEFRVIPLDGRPHPGSDITLWMGDSRARWEDTTLVVDVTNHNASTRFSVVGDFHSDEMGVTERFVLIDQETIEYQATIADPQVYTRPWTLGVTLKRDTVAGNEILEYAGVEGEKDAGLMVEIPAGVGP